MPALKSPVSASTLDEPRTVDDRRNDAELEAFAFALLDGGRDAFLEQGDRPPVVAEQVVALPEPVKQLALDARVAVLPREAQAALAELDCAPLLAAKKW